MATTSNRGNPYPTDTDVVDVPADIQALAEALDDAPRYDQGPYSSLGSAVRGKLFRTSEDGLLHVSDGSTWGAVGKIPVVTGLPGSPVDGQEVLYVSNGTTREKWHLRYDSGKAGSYKWEAISAKPLAGEAGGNVNTASTSYVALTGGPSVTLPLAGEYDVGWGAMAGPNTDGYAFVYMTVAGAGGTVSEIAHMSAHLISFDSISRFATLTLPVGSLAGRYRVSGGTGNFENRWLRATPLWVG